MGRPSHAPEPFHRRQVEAMAGYGIPEIDIARVLGIDPKTQRKHYRDELDTGHVLANAKVAESLSRKATGDHRQSVTAAIFWLKTPAGWKEKSSEFGTDDLTIKFVTHYEAPPEVKAAEAHDGAALRARTLIGATERPA